MVDKLNIHQRLHAVMKKVDYIQKEKKSGMNYSIVSHDAVTAKIRPELVDQGVIYYPCKIERRQDGNRTELDVTVRFVNVDVPSDFIDVSCVGYGIDSQDKGPGKATSYAVKYALLKALGMETGDDPEYDQVTEHKSNFDEMKAEAASILKAIKSAPNKTALDALEVQVRNKLTEIKKASEVGYANLLEEFSIRQTKLLGEKA